MKRYKPASWLAFLVTTILLFVMGPAAALGDVPSQGVNAINHSSRATFHPLAVAPSASLVFRGTANVVLRHYDYCTTQRRFIGEQTYARPVTLLVGPSLHDSNGVRDPNPFTFSLATDVQAADGAWGLTSSFYGRIIGGSQRDILFVYWSFTYDAQTGAISGTLANSHKYDAAALNLVFSQDLPTCIRNSGVYPLADDLNIDGYRTALAGNIGDQSAHIQVLGSSWNGNRDIFIDATLSR
ncbi:hypothetical protein ACQCSX_22765 (plasmid) [Pseudarthrobacter sp. P1]|uniref:hypothetical protein n=1 Tax=Pseudarthrobacter sp. P1 TaxID=3418418 RepID=UPI003CFB6B94